MKVSFFQKILFRLIDFFGAAERYPQAIKQIF